MNIEHLSTVDYMYKGGKLRQVEASFAPLIKVGEEYIPCHIGTLHIQIRRGKAIETYRLLPQLTTYVHQHKYTCVDVGGERIVLGEMEKVYMCRINVVDGYIMNDYYQRPVLIAGDYQQLPYTTGGKQIIYAAARAMEEGMKSYRVQYTYGGKGIGWFTRVTYL